MRDHRDKKNEWKETTNINTNISYNIRDTARAVTTFLYNGNLGIRSTEIQVGMLGVTYSQFLTTVLYFDITKTDLMLPEVEFVTANTLKSSKQKICLCKQ